MPPTTKSVGFHRGYLRFPQKKVTITIMVSSNLCKCVVIHYTWINALSINSIKNLQLHQIQIRIVYVVVILLAN